ncbi:MAG: hypothetical protein ACJ77B_09455 [Chloroflexota bacterium]
MLEMVALVIVLPAALILGSLAVLAAIVAALATADEPKLKPRAI